MSTIAATPTERLPFWRQIRWNLVFFFVILAIIPIAIVTTFDFFELRNQAIADATVDMEAIAELKQKQIELWIDGNQNALELLTGAGSVNRVATTNNLSPEDQASAGIVLQGTIRANPNFKELFVYNLDGRVVVSSSESEIGKVVTRQPYFEASTQENQREFLQPPYFELSTSELTVIITSQLFDEEGQLGGVVAGRLDISVLSDIMTDQQGLRDTGETYLVSLENNYFLTESRFEGYELTRAYRSEGIDNVLRGDDGSGTYNNYRDPSVSVIGAYRWLPDLEVGLIAEITEEEAVEPAVDTRNTAILIGAIASFLTAAAGFYIASRLSKPITELTETARRIGSGNLDERARVQGRNEVGILGNTINQMAEQIQDTVGSLEHRVEERTKDLRTTLDVGRLATTLGSSEEFYERLVNFILDNFDLYYAQIYLLDEAKRFATLRAGTGDVGQQLIGRNHRLDMNATSIVARSVQTNETILVSNTDLSDFFLPNPLLPETRSEVAIPLSVGGNILGVLDMQATTPDTFNETNLFVFETMANQLAGVIQSNFAFEETRAAIIRADEINRRMTRENWEGYLSRVGQGQKVGYRYDLETPTPLDEWTTLPEVIVEEPTQSHSIRPIRLGGQNIGNIVVSEEGDRAWSEDELSLIEDVAERVAQAVEQLRAFDETETRARELATVADVSAQAATTLNPQELLEAVANLTKERFNLYHAHIYLLDDSKQNLVLAAGAGEAGRQMASGGHSIALNREHSLVARAARTRQGVIANNVASAADFLPNPLLPDTKSEMAIPMIVGDEVVGVLDTQASTVNRFTEEDIRVKTTLAEQLAIALSNARQFQRTQAALAQTEAQAQALAQLNEMSAELTNASTSSEIFEIAAVKLGDIFEATRASIAMLNEANNTLEIFALKGDGGAIPLGMTLPVKGTSIGQTVRERRVINTADAQKSELKDVQGLAKQGIRSTISAPMTASGRVLGTVNLASEKLNSFTRQDENLLQQTASLLASTLENQRLFDQTQRALSQTATLYETGQAIAAANTISEILEAVVKAVPDYLDTVNINVFDDPIVDAKQKIGMIETIGSWRSNGDDSLNGYRYNLDELPIVKWMIQQDFVVPTLDEDERIDDVSRQGIADLSLNSLIGSIMQVGDRQLGFILYGSEAPQNFADDDIRFLRALTDQTVTAIESLRSFDAVVKARQEVERVYNASIDLIGSANFDGYFVNLNPAWLTTLGYELEELMKYPFIEFVHSDDVELTHAAIERLTKGAEAFSFENRYQKKDGTYTWLSWNAAPDMESGLIHFVTRDISDQRRQQAEIEKRATELQVVAEVSAAAATTLDQQQLLDTFSNLTRDSFELYHAHIYLLDESGDTLILKSGAGNVGTMMVGAGHRISLHQQHSIVARAASTGESVISNDVSQEPNFLPNPMLPNTKSEMAIPIIAGEFVIGVLDVQADKTDNFDDADAQIITTLARQLSVALSNAELYQEQLETAERLREVDRLKSEFLASMSHELRTPLNSIIGYAEVMLDGLDGPLNEEMEEDIAAIHGSGKLLLNLINDILDLAKIEAGQMELEFEPVNLVEFMQEMVRSSGILVKDKSVDLFLEVDEASRDAIPEEIQADPIRLRQIVNNLLSNAAKFTDNGSITIGLAVENGNIRTSVTDTGIGMKQEQLDLIFERFRQVDQSSTRRHQGTGLGLDITRRLVHMHGGEIHVDSEPDKGSCFSFTIPLSREVDEKQVEEKMTEA